MPITGTHLVAAKAVIAAENAVKATWLAKNRVLTAAEQAQMLEEVRAAGIAALFAHMVTNTTVVVLSVSGVTTGPGVSGPGAGTIT